MRNNQPYGSQKAAPLDYQASFRVGKVVETSERTSIMRLTSGAGGGGGGGSCRKDPWTLG